jgi:hypothetical protein
MRTLIGAVAVCLLTLPGLCQSTSQYQVAIITEVKAHPVAGDTTSDSTSYDVSVKVGNTIYVVLYTPQLSELPPKYVTGRELLVFVGKGTITYNDMLGQSHEVQIESRRFVTEPKKSK